MKLTNRNLFLVGLLIGMGIMLVPAGYQRLVAARTPKTTALTDTVAVTAQIEPPQVRAIARANYRTLIDFRPDGEDTNQASSQTMAFAARRYQLEFHYLPVPHGNTVPEAAVKKLTQILHDAPKPILMYCRTGRRATRTWSLAEASRPGGASVEDIFQAARGTGHSIEDLRGSIQARVATRKTTSNKKEGDRASGNTTTK